jgi:hypothetical protein
MDGLKNKSQVENEYFIDFSITGVKLIGKHSEAHCQHLGQHYN